MAGIGKYILIITLLIIIAILMYRIFDLGVTLTYLENDLESTQKELEKVKAR